MRLTSPKEPLKPHRRPLRVAAQRGGEARTISRPGGSFQDDSLDRKGPTINFTYSPRLNTKFGIEYSAFAHTSGVNETVTSLAVQLVFYSFA